MAWFTRKLRARKAAQTLMALPMQLTRDACRQHLPDDSGDDQLADWAIEGRLLIAAAIIRACRLSVPLGQVNDALQQELYAAFVAQIDDKIVAETFVYKLVERVELYSPFLDDLASRRRDALNVGISLGAELSELVTGQAVVHFGSDVLGSMLAGLGGGSVFESDAAKQDHLGHVVPRIAIEAFVKAAKLCTEQGIIA